MWRHFYRVAAGVTGTIVAFGLLVSAAPAASLSKATSTSAQTQAAAADSKRFAAEIRLLDPYVVRNQNGTLVLAAPASVRQQVKTSDLAILEGNLTAVNDRILAGQLATTATHLVYDPSNRDFGVQWNQQGVEWHWWGVTLWLNEYWTVRVYSAVFNGEGIFALCALLAIPNPATPAAVLCVVAAFLVAGGAFQMWLEDRGGGVAINCVLYTGPYCWTWAQ